MSPSGVSRTNGRDTTSLGASTQPDYLVNYAVISGHREESLKGQARSRKHMRRWNGVPPRKKRLRELSRKISKKTTKGKRERDEDEFAGRIWRAARMSSLILEMRQERKEMTESRKNRIVGNS